MRRVLVLSAVFFAVISTFNSCKKSGELTPLNVSSDFNAFFTDEITVLTTTELDPPLRTDETSRSLFGIYNDPVFGTTIASNYVQFNLSTSNLEFPAGTTIDSVLLKVAFDNLYGNINSKLNMEVYELLEDLSFDEEYTHSSTLSFKETILGSKSFVPDLTDTSTTDTTVTGVHVSFPLDIEIGQRILNQGIIDNNTELLTIFKGLHFKPNQDQMPAIGDGVIAYLNMLSTNSRIIIHFQYPSSDGGVVNARYPLLVGVQTPRFSNFVHDYTGTTVEPSIGVVNQSECYIQPMAGLRTRLDIPSIKELTEDGNIVVNKAEIVITVKSGTDEDSPAPASLILLTESEDGVKLFLPDFYEGSTYFGGGLDPNTKTYRFNIARYINEIVNEGREDLGMFLSVSGSSVTGNRLIINGGDFPEDRLRLNLTYTKL